jgi:hypothetical protein
VVGGEWRELGMKLRLLGSKVRLRLTVSEVEALARGETLGERLTVEGDSPASWSYSVRLDGEIDSLGVRLDGSGLEVSLPAEQVADWAESDREGLYGAKSGLEVSVEKDFPCSHDGATGSGE